MLWCTSAHKYFLEYICIWVEHFAHEPQNLTATVAPSNFSHCIVLLSALPLESHIISVHSSFLYVLYWCIHSVSHKTLSSPPLSSCRCLVCKSGRIITFFSSRQPHTYYSFRYVVYFCNMFCFVGVSFFYILLSKIYLKLMGICLQIWSFFVTSAKPTIK